LGRELKGKNYEERFGLELLLRNRARGKVNNLALKIMKREIESSPFPKEKDPAETQRRERPRGGSKEAGRERNSLCVISVHLLRRKRKAERRKGPAKKEQIKPARRNGKEIHLLKKEGAEAPKSLALSPPEQKSKDSNEGRERKAEGISSREKGKSIPLGNLGKGLGKKLKAGSYPKRKLRLPSG